MLWHQSICAACIGHVLGGESVKCELIITPRELIHKGVVRKKITLDQYKSRVIMGRLLDYKARPIKNAVIQISKVAYEREGEFTTLQGYVITNQEGKFAFAVEECTETDYELKIYEPMIQC